MSILVIGHAAMVLHMAFLVYVVIGGYLAWRWPRAFWPHLACALYALGITVIGWDCPLTHVENWGRVNAGQSPIESPGFTEHYLGGVVYPSGQLELAHTGAGVIVTISYAGAVWWHLRRRRRAREYAAAA
jgi:hypothetical protein